MKFLNTFLQDMIYSDFVLSYETSLQHTVTPKCNSGL